MLRLLVLVAALSGCAPVVPLRDMWAIDSELAGMAGAGYQQDMLLTRLGRAARSPSDRAEVARRRCGWAWAQRGSVAAIAACRRAVVLGDWAGGDAEWMNRRRLALVLTEAGQASEAMRILRDLVPSDPLEAAQVAWARVQALLAMGRPGEAVAEAQRGRVLTEAAVRRDSRHDSFLAIADLRLGEALRGAGRFDEARAILLRGLARQRALVAESPEYAEYELYLARLLAQLGLLPGGEEAAKEAADLMTDLRHKDPTRAEYRPVRK